VEQPNTTPAHAHRRYPLKRPVETVLAALLALVTLPVLLVIAALSAIKYRSWPFFVQQRVGLHGTRFGVIKIRSLPATTAPYADRDELDQTEIHGYGSFIRSTHLDELPQLWQVVTGTMGLVGPRPMIESIVNRMDPDHITARHTMRPGVTGLWQVSEYGSRLVLEASEYDTYYVTTANLRLDAWILWTTAKQTFGAKPVSSAQFPAWIALPEPVTDANVLDG
jgi:lipopolysaccharide/colanic/teichoic acid biosynthesis glycosyltransferase